MVDNVKNMSIIDSVKYELVFDKWKQLSELIIDFLVEYDMERVVFAKNTDEAYGC